MRTVSLTLAQAADEQFREPVQHVYLDFDRDGIYEVDVTSDVESISDNHELQSGGGLKRGKPSADQASLVLFNEDGKYSPHNANSPYNGYIVTGVGIQIRAGFDDEEVPIFTGVILSWNQSRNKSTTSIKCKDKTYYMQRKDADNVLEINVPMKVAIEKLVNWTFGEGVQPMVVDNIPMVIPVLEFTNDTKVWSYIQVLAESCDARAYFDGAGVFHFHSKLSTNVEDLTPVYHFTADKLFSLDEQFDQTEVKNKWTIKSEYLTLHPEQPVWGTPEEEVELVEDYVVGDSVKNAVNKSTKTIQLKTKPEGSSTYEDTWNVPLIKVEVENDVEEVAVKVHNATKGVDLKINHTTTNINTGLIVLDSNTILEDGDILTVTYKYHSLVMLAGKKRTWYADLEHKSYNIRSLEFAANDSDGTPITCATTDTANALSVVDYTAIRNDRLRVTLRNNSSKTATISTMIIKANPILASSPLTAICEDQESMNEYGVLEEEIANNFITSEDYIQKVAAFLCDSYKRPRSIVKADIKGLPQLEIGDRVRVTEMQTGIDYDFIVTAIDDKWSNGSWDATLALEQADVAQWVYVDGRSTIVNRSGGRAATVTTVRAGRPQNLRSTTNFETNNKARINLNWDVVPDPRLSHYQVYCQFPDTTAFAYVGRTADTEATFVHGGLDFGKAYGYQVTAVVDGIESPRSDIYVATAGDNKRPATPLNQIAVGGMNHIALSWNPVYTNYDGTSAGDIVKYRVYTIDGTTETFLTDIPFPATSFNHGGLGHGITIAYKVTAIDINDNESDKPAVTISATTLHPDVEDTTKPPAPSGLTAMAIFKGIVLTWGAISTPRIDYYIIEYDTSADNVTWSNNWLAADSAFRSTYFTHQQLNPTLYYKYRVKARSTAGIESEWSAESTPQKPLKASLSEDVVGQLARDYLADGIIDYNAFDSNLQGKVGSWDATTKTVNDKAETWNKAASVDGLVTWKSEFKHSPDEIETTVSAVYPSGDTSGTSYIKQNSERIDQTVAKLNYVSKITGTITAIGAAGTNYLTDTNKNFTNIKVGDVTIDLIGMVVRIEVTNPDDNKKYGVLRTIVSYTANTLTLNDPWNAKYMPIVGMTYTIGSMAVSTATQIDQTNEAIRLTAMSAATGEALATSFASLDLTAEEISSTVKEVWPTGSSESTILQNARNIALKLTTTELGNELENQKEKVIAAINLNQEGVRIEGKNLLLDGNTKVIGTLDVVPDSQAGHTAISVADSTTERLVVGHVGGKYYAGSQIPTGKYGIWGLDGGIYLQGYTKIISAGQVTMPSAPNTDKTYGIRIPLDGTYPRDSVIVMVNQVAGGGIPFYIDSGYELYAVPTSLGVKYYEQTGVNSIGYPLFDQKTIEDPTTGAFYIVHNIEANFVGFKPTTPTISEVLISAVIMHTVTSNMASLGLTLYTVGEYGIPEVNYAILLRG